MNGLPFFLCDFWGAFEERLLCETKELLRLQFVLPRFGTSKKTKVKYHDILVASIHLIENCPQVVKGVVVSDHHQDVSWPNAECFGSEVLTGFQIELIKLSVFRCAFSGHPFRSGKHSEKDNCEGAS